MHACEYTGKVTPPPVSAGNLRHFFVFPLPFLQNGYIIRYIVELDLSSRESSYVNFFLFNHYASVNSAIECT